MVPKVHARGTSFKGLAAYLLHDKGERERAERLAWVETRNLATSDPEVAWRIMAATAKDQDRLKAGAGVKNSGRKSHDHVMHYVLAWHPHEAAGLTREEMVRAAIASLKVIGREENAKTGQHRQFADEHQAMFVCHADEPHPHVHVVVNRVHPEHGRMLTPKHDQLALSRWAEAYEKERGQIFCEERVLNNAARDRDEFTRGEKDQARNVYDVERPANDNSPDAQTIAAEQRRKAAALARRSRDMRARHAQEWARLGERHRARTAETERSAQRQAAASLAAVRETFRPHWRDLLHENTAARAQFEAREQRLFGRVQNAFKAIDFQAIVHGKDRRAAVSDAFQAFASAGARLEALNLAQDRAARALRTQQQQAEQLAARRAETQRQGELARNRATLEAERAQLILAHEMDRAALRAHWKQRAAERAEAWEPLRRAAQLRAQLQEQARQQQAQARETARPPAPPKTPPQERPREKPPEQRRPLPREERADERAAMLARFEAFAKREPDERSLTEQFNAQVVRSAEESSSGDAQPPTPTDADRLARFERFLGRAPARDVGRDRGGNEGGGPGGRE